MRLSGRLFRRHVGRRSQDPAVGRHGGLARVAFGHAKIHQVRPLLAIENDVRRLNIAVHDAMLVRVLQGAREFAGNAGRLLRRERSVFQRLFQRGAVDVLANQKPDVVFGLAGFVQRDDRGMGELGHAAGLAQEPLHLLRRCQAPGPLHFERDHAFEPGIPSLKHIAERADAQFRTQFEPVEPHDAF